MTVRVMSDISDDDVSEGEGEAQIPGMNSDFLSLL